MKAVELLKEIFLFVILLLLQVLILNRITLFGFATPLLYIYFVIKLPFWRNKFYVIISAFLLGLMIDTFLNTPGVNAATITIAATFRMMVAPLFYPKKELEVIAPSLMGGVGGTNAFIKYSIVLVLIHHSFLFLIDALSLFNIMETLLRIASSSAITIVLVLAIDALFYRKGRTVG